MAFSIYRCGDKATSTSVTTETSFAPPPYAIVIHGGAGTILKEHMSAEKDSLYRAALNRALDIGETILKDGGTALDAVESTIRWMEDNPLFNAGKGAVFTHNGTNELDASIMDGATHNAGAVGGINTVKHPISAARAVMEKSEHVMMVGKGAETFAHSIGLEQVDPSYFHTDRRWESLQRVLDREKKKQVIPDKDKHGTVGCVALDAKGNVAAGTSTGGMTNKKYNRIGDSPIIGAGTYADNATCGVSATGWGEYFIRYTVARDIAAMMEYGDHTLSYAADYIILDKLKTAGGTGGIVAIDRMGHISMPFNTEGMYRGWRKPDESYVGIYADE